MSKFPLYFQKNIQSTIQKLRSEHSTPFLIIDLSVIKATYLELKEHFSSTDIFYAVKANPAPEILALLARLNSSFDLASANELKLVLDLNIKSENLSFGNTIKKKEDITFFYKHGVRLFATDSEKDLENIAKYAPGSKVYFRLLFDASASSDWPLSNKFGCDKETIVLLAQKAVDLGLIPYGISFHVGSQQKNPKVWVEALTITDQIFTILKTEYNIHLKMLNLGGGLPALYRTQTPTLSDYVISIQHALDEFKEKHHLEKVIMEPGRSLVGNAGILVSKVLLKSPPKIANEKPWLYLDIGTYNGLYETVGESIQYKILTDEIKDSDQQEAFTLAGPTCDSVDIMYQKEGYLLPSKIDIDDHLYWLSTGAYTVSYSSISFNGFEPLKYFII